jgi:hypothetical protein
MLQEAFGEHFLNGIIAFEAGQVSAEDDECSGRPSISEITENAENIQNSSRKTIPKQCMSSQKPWYQLRSLPGDLNRKCELFHVAVKIAPRPLSIDQKQQHINTCIKLPAKATETQLLSLGLLCFPNRK